MFTLLSTFVQQFVFLNMTMRTWMMTIMMTMITTMMMTIMTMTIITLKIFFSPQAVAELGVNAEPKKPGKQICSCWKIVQYSFSKMRQCLYNDTFSFKHKTFFSEIIRTFHFYFFSQLLDKQQKKAWCYKKNHNHLSTLKQTLFVGAKWLHFYTM